MYVRATLFQLCITLSIDTRYGTSRRARTTRCNMSHVHVVVLLSSVTPLHPVHLRCFTESASGCRDWNIEMASSDIFTAVVERTRVEEPWGLRIEGGTDCRQPFSVCKVRQLHQFVLYSPSYKLKLQISQAQSNRQTDTSDCQFV